MLNIYFTPQTINASSILFNSCVQIKKLLDEEISKPGLKMKIGLMSGQKVQGQVQSKVYLLIVGVSFFEALCYKPL